MSTKKNKYHYDVKNCYRFKGTRNDDGTITYSETPVREPGIRSFEAEAQGDLTVIRADGIDYIVAANNAGYEITLNFVKVSDEFKVDQLGEVVDPKTGIQYEDANATPAPFALCGEFKGDVEGIRWIYYNVTASRTNDAGDNKDNQKEPDEESITCKASPLPVTIDGDEHEIVKAAITKSMNAETWGAWFTGVTLPGGAAEQTEPPEQTEH